MTHCGVRGARKLTEGRWGGNAGGLSGNAADSAPGAAPGEVPGNRRRRALRARSSELFTGAHAAEVDLAHRSSDIDDTRFFLPKLTRALALAVALSSFPSLTGCAGLGIYTVPTSRGPARGVPDAAFDLALGNTTLRALTDGGWALAERKQSESLWVKAVTDPAIRDVEAGIRESGDGNGSVEWVRVFFKGARWTTYERLLNDLVESHGPPQGSVETASYEHFSPGTDLHRVRPSRFVVHRWSAPGRDLVLVAGLEVMENMRTGMEYQLLLLRAP